MLRNIGTSDFNFVYNLYMHPSVNPFLLYEKMSVKAFLPIYNELLAQNIIYVFSENGQDIGMFKLVRLQHRCSHIAYLGGVAIAPTASGRGFGAKMFGEIIALGQNMGLKRIELSVATHNTKAIQLYEKQGFVAEGILKNYTYLKSEERYLDEILMAYLY
jgi:L-phenylalanine/L-methionine N-acetyltransferase